MDYQPAKKNSSCSVRRLSIVVGFGVFSIRPNNVAARILEGSFHVLSLVEGYVVVRRLDYLIYFQQRRSRVSRPFLAHFGPGWGQC